MNGRNASRNALSRIVSIVLSAALMLGGVPSQALAEAMDELGGTSLQETPDGVEQLLEADDEEVDAVTNVDATAVEEGAVVEETSDEEEVTSEMTSEDEEALDIGLLAAAGEEQLQSVVLEDIPYEGARIAQIALGEAHAVALTRGGKVWTWGSNGRGQLGDGTTTDSPVPILVEGLDKVVKVAAGGKRTAVITESGELWMWGANRRGELGVGTKSDIITPVKVEGLEDVSQVSMASEMSLAVTTSGELYLWGFNYFSSITGAGTTEIVRPRKVMDGVASAEMCGQGLAVLTTDGDLYMAGSNTFGELGDGTTTTRTQLVKILDGVVQVSLGSFHSAALKSVGSSLQVFTWGRSDSGELGIPGAVEAGHCSTPRCIDSIANVAHVELGGYHSAAVTQSGALYMWGRNKWGTVSNTDQNGGQLGDGTSTNRAVPFMLAQGVAQVALGDLCSAAVTDDGALYTWGCNYNGQLGDGTTAGRSTPVAVAGITNDQLDVSEAVVGIKDPLYTEDGKDYFAYTGGQVKPVVAGVTLNEEALTEGTDYAVSYGTNTDFGIGTITITGAGNYTGSRTLEFYIVPDKVRNVHAPEQLTDENDPGLVYTNYRREADLSWDVVAGEDICYEVSCSRSQEFKENETESSFSTEASLPETDNENPRPLERKGLYYYRVRAFVGIPNSGECAYGPWSDIIRVKAGNQILASEMWKVKNIGDDISSYKLTLDDYRRVFKNAEAMAIFMYQAGRSEDKYQAERIVMYLAEELCQKDWNLSYEGGGLCVGIVDSGVAYHEHGVPRKGSYAQEVDKTNYKTIHAGSFGLSWLQCTRYAQVMQFTQGFWQELESNQRDRDGLYNAVVACQQGRGAPVEIYFTSGGHTHHILAVGVREENEREATLEVYDPNRGKDDPTALVLYKDDETSSHYQSWSFEGKFGTGLFVTHLGPLNQPDSTNAITWLTRFSELTADTLDQIEKLGDVEHESYNDVSTRELIMWNGDVRSSVWQAFKEEIEESFKLDNIFSFISTAEASDGDSESDPERSLGYWVQNDHVDLPNVPAGTVLTLAHGDKLIRVTTSVENDVQLELKDDETARVELTPDAEGTCTVVVYESDSKTQYTENSVIRMAISPSKQLVVSDHDGIVDIVGASSVSISKTSGVEDENLCIPDAIDTTLGAMDVDSGVTYSFTGQGTQATLSDANGNVVATGDGTDMNDVGEASGALTDDIVWSLSSGGVLTISGEGDMPDFTSKHAEDWENAITGRVACPWDSRRENIKAVVVGDGVTRVGSYAFAGYENLRRVVLPDTLQSIGDNAFLWCAALTTARLPEGLASIEGYAFYGCSALKKAVLPTTLVKLGDYAFTEAGLTSVMLPANLNTLGINIFWDCDELVSVTFENGATLVGNGMFYDCSKLEEVELPEGMEKIGDSAFGRCSELVKVAVPASVTTIGENAFVDSPKVVIACQMDSEAMAYARDNGLATSATGEHEQHFWTSWKVASAATALEKGSKVRTCRICDKSETEDISKLEATAKLTAPSLKMRMGQKTTKFKVYGLAKGDYVKKWKSSNVKLLKVAGKKTGSCTLTALKKKGKVKVSATLASGKVVSFTVTVQAAKVKTTAIKLGVKTPLTIKKGKRQAIGVTLAPVTSQDKVTYASSNTKVATVSAQGTIVAKKVGTCRITVKAGTKTTRITVKVTN